MGQKPSNDTGHVPEPTKNDSDTFVLLATMADTTWRMFVPSIGFTLIGVQLDKQCGTKPWLMTAGIIVGAFFAYVLVKRQVDGIRRSKQHAL